MNTLSQKPVGQIVAEDYRTAQVLRSHGLDFCCGGGKPLAEACQSKQIDIETVISELNAINMDDNVGDNYNEWDLDFLADYIVNTHHSYVLKMLPELNFYAEKVARVHGERYDHLYDVLHRIRLLTEEMRAHLKKEEEELFPQIKALVRENKKGLVREAIVEALEDEHDKAGSLMEEIEQLTDGFTPPADACASFQVYFKNLAGFQKDLHKHVHLENNILFPKALDLEKRLN